MRCLATVPLVLAVACGPSSTPITSNTPPLPSAGDAAGPTQPVNPPPSGTAGGSPGAPEASALPPSGVYQSFVDVRVDTCPTKAVGKKFPDMMSLVLMQHEGDKTFTTLTSKSPTAPGILTGPPLRIELEVGKTTTKSFRNACPDYAIVHHLTLLEATSDRIKTRDLITHEGDASRCGGLRPSHCAQEVVTTWKLVRKECDAHCDAQNLGGWAYTEGQPAPAVQVRCACPQGERGEAAGSGQTESVPAALTPLTAKSALVIVLDRSGSMTGLPIRMARAGCSKAAAELGRDDAIEIIALDSQPTRYLGPQLVDDLDVITKAIERIQPGGGTHLFSALDMAYGDLQVVTATRKHVLLVTDGKAPSQGLRDLVRAMRGDGITVSAVSLGPETDVRLLGMIAAVGGGRLHQLPDPMRLPAVFQAEARKARGR